MNETLAYFGLKYNNPTLFYLALFALTPHPYNNDYIYIDPNTGERVRSRQLPRDVNIPKENILRSVGRETDLLEALKGESRLSPSEKAVLESAKEKLDRSGKVLPGQSLSREERRAVRRGNLFNRQKRKASRQYRPDQIQAVQRKNVLRPRALKLDEQSSVFPTLTKGNVLENSYNLFRDDRVRQYVNDTGVLDRYYRQVMGQMTEADKALPKIHPKQAKAARERLARLSDAEWDMLSGAYRGLNEIRREGQPAQQVISKKTSPIGREAKPDTVKSIQNQQASLIEEAAKTGIDPRTQNRNPPVLVPNPNEIKANIPSYVGNPESVQYVIDNSPAAQASKGRPMQVKYDPQSSLPERKTGLERRIERIARAREIAQTNNINLPFLGEPQLRGTGTDRLGPFDPDIKTKPILPPSDIPAMPPRARDGGESITLEILQRRRNKPGRVFTPPPKPIESIKSLEPQYKKAIEAGLMDINQLPLDQLKQVLSNTPVAPRPKNPFEQQIANNLPNVLSRPRLDGPININPTARNTVQLPNFPSIQAPSFPTLSVGNVFDSVKQKGQQVLGNTANTVKQAATGAGNWYINNVVNIGRQPNQIPFTPPPIPTPPPAATAAAAGNAANTAAQTVTNAANAATKAATNATGPTVVLDVSEIEKAVRDVLNEYKQQTPKPTPKPRSQKLQLKGLLSGFPNLSDSQKRGLLKLGAGVAGAGGVLLGGSLLADSFIRNREKSQIDRQQRLYSNETINPEPYPPLPPPPASYPPPYPYPVQNPYPYGGR